MGRENEGDGVRSFSCSHQERKQRMLKGLTYDSGTFYSIPSSWLVVAELPSPSPSIPLCISLSLLKTSHRCSACFPGFCT